MLFLDGAIWSQKMQVQVQMQMQKRQKKDHAVCSV